MHAHAYSCERVKNEIVATPVKADKLVSYDESDAKVVITPDKVWGSRNRCARKRPAYVVEKPSENSPIYWWLKWITLGPLWALRELSGEQRRPLKLLPSFGGQWSEGFFFEELSMRMCSCGNC